MAARRTFRCRGRDATISRRRKSDVRLAVHPPQLSGVCPRTRGGRQRMIRLVVSETGKVKNAKVARGIDPGMRCRSTARDTVDARLDPRPAKRPKGAGVLHPSDRLHARSMTHRKHKKIPAPSGAGIFLIEEVWVISLPQSRRPVHCRPCRWTRRTKRPRQQLPKRTAPRHCSADERRSPDRPSGGRR